MSIKRTIITTIVVLALVAVVAPGVTQATTIDDLLAQIAQLQSQLSQLQTGGTTTPAAGVPSACAGVKFSRNLIVGSTGSDVKCLQALLNLKATTKVALTGAGSPGMETTYFGPKTLVAVRVYQAEHGWTPANQVGPMTRATLNAQLGGGVVVPPVTPPVTGPVSAALASDTPAAGAIIGGQALADLLHVNLTGNGTVTSVTLQRSGISDQNTLTNVYLFDGNTRLTDGYSFNANSQIVFNGLNIAVSGSKVISVKVDVSSTAANNASSIAVALTGLTANGTATTANVMGNSMTIAIGNPASFSIGSNTVGNATINAGTTQYTFWSAPVQINTRTVMLKLANFRMVGSAPSDALANIKLFVDGVDTGKVATVVSISGSNYAMFDLTSAPVSLTTGSHTVDVRADIQKGTNRDVTVSVQQTSDLTVFDPQLGVNLAATSGVPNTAGKIGISTGSVTTVIDPTFTSQTNISSGATNAIIARFKIHAYGEDVKVGSLVVTPKLANATAGSNTTNGSGACTGTCGLNNVTLYFNGSQIGSQQNMTGGTQPLTFQLGSQMIAPAGQDSYIEVRADLQTTGNVPYTAGKLTVTLPTGSSNAQGQSSQSTVNVPTAQVATAGLTVSSANLAVSANSAYLAQTLSPNTAGVKIGSYVIQNQSTSQAIRLTSLNVQLTFGAGTAVTNFAALRTSDTTGSGSTPIQPTGNDNFSISDVLQPGASMTLDIFADAGASAASNATVQTKLTVASIGAVDNIPSAGTQKTGQVIKFNTGVIANPPTLVVSSTTPSQYVIGGAANASQASFNFVATGSSATIQELKVVVTGSDNTPSDTVTNICVGSVCAQPVAGIADLTGLSLNVPLGGGLSQNVLVSYSGVGLSGIDPATTSDIALEYVKYQSGGSTRTLCTSGCDDTLSVAVPAPIMTLVSSVPTVVVNQTTPASGLILGAESQVGAVTVTAAPASSIKVKQIVFNLGFGGFSTNPTMSSPRLASGSTTITGATCSGTTTVTCTFTGASYDTDYTIAAGQSQTFNLYAANAGGIVSSGAKASISSSITKSDFKWDDTSTNGASGTNLAGTLVPNFPTNSWSIQQ